MRVLLALSVALGVVCSGLSGPPTAAAVDPAAIADSLVAADQALRDHGRRAAAVGQRLRGHPDRAIYSYNHSDHYVRAVNDYAAVLGSDSAVLPSYHRRNVYYHTTSGDVMLPVGHAASERIPVDQYLAAHPR